MSQAFQVEEDLERKDMTFTARYGLAGVKRCYAILFPAGVLILAAALASVDRRLGGVFLLLGAGSGAGVWRVVRDLRMAPGEYGRIMAVKYTASGLFLGFLALVLGLQWSGAIPFR